MAIVPGRNRRKDIAVFQHLFWHQRLEEVLIILLLYLYCSNTYNTLIIIPTIYRSVIVQVIDFSSVPLLQLV